MLPERILNDVQRLSDADRCELINHLKRTNPARPASARGWPWSFIPAFVAFFLSKLSFSGSQRSTPASIPPPRPASIDDLLKLLNDNNVDQMSDYLQRTGNANVSMNLNTRPVFFARSAEMVDLLVEAGADVDTIDDLGSTAAHLIACYDARRPALEHLVKAGANLSRINSHFETPLDVAHREKALANAAWLESIGAEPGPLATYRRLHPLLRAVSATRPAGPMPSLAQPIHDRSALWRHLRNLIRFWDPTVDWQIIDRAATAATLNSLAGIELPAACLEFHQSGIFDWISWKGGNKEPAFARCSWAAAEAMGRRPADEYIPIMQYSNHGLYCLERDELGSADPAVRFLPRQDLSNAHRKPPYSYHTGCCFSEFVANAVYSELVEVTPAQRSVDLESGDEPAALRLRERLTRIAMPRVRCVHGNVNFVRIYEGPDMLFKEIESPSQRRSYYGILAGDSEQLLSEFVGEEEEEKDYEEEPDDI